MKICILDGYSLNPGDLDWSPVERLGDVTLFDRTPADKIVERAADADIVLTNKVPFSADTLRQLPRLRFICVLATGYNIIVKVLGTKFNFCDYPKETQALVALDEGKVNMTCIESKQEITLLPNQHVVFDKKTGAMTLLDTKTLANKCQWTKGIIAFNGESLKDIAAVLERCYSIKFKISPSKQNSLHFYGVFYRNSQNVYDIMEALAATGKFTYKISGKTIIIQ